MGVFKAAVVPEFKPQVSHGVSNGSRFMSRRVLWYVLACCQPLCLSQQNATLGGLTNHNTFSHTSAEWEVQGWPTPWLTWTFLVHSSLLAVSTGTLSLVGTHGERERERKISLSSSSCEIANPAGLGPHSCVFISLLSPPTNCICKYCHFRT